MNVMTEFGILVLTIVVASPWGCGSTATQERTGEYPDDSVITAKVKAAILNDRESGQVASRMRKQPTLVEVLEPNSAGSDP